MMDPPHESTILDNFQNTSALGKLMSSLKTRISWAMGVSTPHNKSRKVVGSICLGLDEEPKSFLNNARVDMVRIENLQIFYKHVQA